MNKPLLSRLTWALLAAAVLLAGIQAYLLLRPTPAAAQAGVQPGDAPAAPLSSPAALSEPSALTASSMTDGRGPEARAAAIPAAPANMRAGGVAPLAANAAATAAAQPRHGKSAPEACPSAGAASTPSVRTREALSSAAPLAMSEQANHATAKARRRDAVQDRSRSTSLLVRLRDLCRPDADAVAQAPLAPANRAAAPLSAEDTVAYGTPERDTGADQENAEAPGSFGNPGTADTRDTEPRNTRKMPAPRDACVARGAGHANGSTGARNSFRALDARRARNSSGVPSASEAAGAAACAPVPCAPVSAQQHESAEQGHPSPAPVDLLQSSDGELSLAADFALYREALEGVDDRLPARRGTERVLFPLPGGEGAQVALRWQADHGRISSLSADLLTAQETRDLRLVIHLLRQSCAGGAEVLDLGLYLIRLPEPGQSEGFVHRAAFLRLSADGQAVRFGD